MSRTYRRKKFPRRGCAQFEEDFVNSHYTKKGRRSYVGGYWDDHYAVYDAETEKEKRKRIKKERAMFYRDGSWVYGNVAYLKHASKKAIRANERDYCAKVNRFEFDDVPDYVEANTRVFVWIAF